MGCRRANFAVEETRVGQRTDFDRLEVDVETNGALDPAEAVSQAAEIARLHLSYFTQMGIVPSLPEYEEGMIATEAAKPIDGGLLELLESKLEDFEQISARSRNTLERQNISTLGDVVTQSRDDILNLDNFEEIAEVLAEHGLRFGMSFERDEAGNVYMVEDSSGNGAGGDDEA